MNQRLAVPESRRRPEERRNSQAIGLDRKFLLPIVGIVTLISMGIGWTVTSFSPFAAIGMLAIGVMAIVAFMRPELTTVFIAFAFYANLPVVVTRFGVPAAVAGATFLALGLPLLHALLVKREPIIINRGLMLMFAYLAVILLSAVASEDFTRSVERITGFVLEGMILYFLIINTVRTPQTLRYVVWALIASGVLMGSLSMVQAVSGNYENDFFGLAQTKDTETTIGAADFFDDKPTAHRLAGPIGSKNRYGQIMVVLLPLAIMRIWAERRRVLQAAAAVAVIPITAGALLTYSRGVGLTLIALLAIMLIMRILPLWKTLFVGAVAAVIITIALPGFAYRFGSVVEVFSLFSGDVEEADGAIRGRATVNLVGFEIIKDHPLLGVGPGQSPLYARTIGNEIGYRWLTTDRRLHNMYLEEGADTGLIGLGVFMAIIAAKVSDLNRLRSKWRSTSGEYYYTILSIILAIFTYLVTAVFLHLSYVRYYWFLLALAGAAIYIYSRESAT